MARALRRFCSQSLAVAFDQTPRSLRPTPAVRSSLPFMVHILLSSPCPLGPSSSKRLGKIKGFACSPKFFGRKDRILLLLPVVSSSNRPREAGSKEHEYDQ